MEGVLECVEWGSVVQVMVGGSVRECGANELGVGWCSASQWRKEGRKY